MCTTKHDERCVDPLASMRKNAHTQTHRHTDKFFLFWGRCGTFLCIFSVCPRGRASDPLGRGFMPFFPSKNGLKNASRFALGVSPHYYLRSSCSSSLTLRNSDPGSHSRHYSPLPTTVRAYIFLSREGFSTFSFVDSHRIVPTHAKRFPQSIWCTRKTCLGGLELVTSTLIEF